MYDALIFDLDGTIIDSEPYAMSLLIRILSEHNLNFEKSQYDHLIGRSRDYCFNFLQSIYPKFTKIDDVFSQFDYDFSSAQFLDSIPLMEGIKELLVALKDNNIKIGLATATEKNRGQSILDSKGLSHFFNACVYGDEVLTSKPAPDIYQKAKSLLDSREPLALEDSISGLTSAFKAKIDVVHFNQVSMLNSSITELAVCDIRSHKELLNRIKFFSSKFKLTGLF